MQYTLNYFDCCHNAETDRYDLKKLLAFWELVIGVLAQVFCHFIQRLLRIVHHVPQTLQVFTHTGALSVF